MGLEIKEIDSKKIWEDFFKECKDKTFLQSFNWGEMNLLLGNKIWRFGIFDKDKILTTFLILKIEAKRGKFLFLPHGPNISQKVENEDLKIQIIKILIEKLKEIAKEEKINFIRIAPLLENSEKNEKIFKNFGFRNSPIHVHPEITWELDISPNYDEILANMRKTTRYLIRQALKNKEIEILKSKDESDLQNFYQIYCETAARTKFTPFSFDYLKSELKAFSPDDQILIILGKYRNQILGGGIFVFWQKIAFYHHGATIPSKIPVSYIVLWEAIREAKKRSCEKFNFWGIAPIEKKSHPWSGLTFFKIGFGGYQKNYLKTKDLPLSPKYWISFLVDSLRKIKRGL